MKKRILRVALSLVMVMTCVIALAGCSCSSGGSSKVKGVEISYMPGDVTWTVTVPENEDGSAKYDFTTTKPEKATQSCRFYLETDNAVIGFDVKSMVYNTSSDYKSKYGEKEASFEGYLEFLDDTELNKTPLVSGAEKLEINGRQALRGYIREGGSGNYKYYGWHYMIGIDDLKPGYDGNVYVYYKSDEEFTEAQELDDETQSIIDSIKITAKE